MRLKLPPTGHLDSASLRRMNYVLKESAGPLLDVDFPKRVPIGISLHFYPGDHAQKMVVRQRGRLVDVYDMRGGPAETKEDGRPGVLPRFKWAPTPRGNFTLAGSGAHVTRSWKYSQIPFGAELRMRAEQVEFRKPGSSRWLKATGADSVFARGPEDRRFAVQDFLIGGRLPERYLANDFGHRAQYLRNRKGRRVGHMIHATTRGERNYGNDHIPLLKSHGCEHMRPADIDECLAKGYFRPGRKFVVHGYDEPLPQDVREFLGGEG